MTSKFTIYTSLGLFSLLCVACSKPAQAPDKPERTQSATVVTVSHQVIARSLQLAGGLVAREEAAVSTELSGFRVSTVLVEAGAEVTKGQPLVRLDDTLLRTQILQQEAVVAQQQVAAERAAQEAQRVNGLDDAGALSREIVAERVLQARSAKAALAQAEAQLKDLRIRQELMTVRAPVAGVVLARAVRPGDIATPGTNMFTMARDRLVELDAEVPEADLAFLKIGTPANIKLASGKQLKGHVRIISPEVDTSTRLGRVRISLPVDADLKPGGFAEAQIETGPKEAMVVPVTAVQYNADGATVMVMDKKQIVHRRPVRTGAVSGKVVEILSGVTEGDTVVSAGAALLLPGDKIKPTARSGEA